MCAESPKGGAALQEHEMVPPSKRRRRQIDADMQTPLQLFPEQRLRLALHMRRCEDCLQVWRHAIPISFSLKFSAIVLNSLVDVPARLHPTVNVLRVLSLAPSLRASKSFAWFSVSPSCVSVVAIRCLRAQLLVASLFVWMSILELVEGLFLCPFCVDSSDAHSRDKERCSFF